MGAAMSIKRQRILIALWIVFSTAFVGFVATKNSDKIKRAFEQASLQQRVALERTKEKAAPIEQVFNLTAVALGIPLGLLGVGMFLIRVARRAT